MRSVDIRDRFLRYFTSRDHTPVPSASLIADDPTLLLVSAGMVPFKPYFAGELLAPWQRATSVQKCVRTVDIDQIGTTRRHSSFLPMCGNFAFGDYFKETAIPLAWELFTRPVADGGFGLPESRLWVTVYLDDDEAEAIWRRLGVPADRIQRLGMEENYWSMGVPGPCGPASEICYDRGPDFGPEGGPAVDGERYVELWNLVFMRYFRGEGGEKTDYPILGELPRRNIDTGLGMERLAAILQDVPNLFEIDTTGAVLARVGELTGGRYGADRDTDVRMRVAADHLRTATMLLSDGVVPGSEGRGYVLRRLLRRAVRNLRLLGAGEPVAGEVVDSAVTAMSPQYPELAADRDRIRAAVAAEEESFLATLRAGTAILDTAVGEAKRAGGRRLPAERAFQLHDTFGFPIDLTLEMAAELGLTVDEAGFRRLMAEQRQRARADARAKKTGHVDITAYRDILATAGGTDFLGYEQTSAEGSVRGLLVGGEPVRSAGEGEEVELVLDRTPFYAEGGGQLADQGLIRVDGGALVRVEDVQAPIGGLVAHRGTVVSGEVAVGRPVSAEIDTGRRRSISRAHTATHLVHRAFREALGETVAQAGSENAPGRFRFDFRAPGAVPQSVLVDVEQRVNEVLSEDLAVTAELMTLEAAREAGAVALFGEKYGDRVRVVSVGDWARELCGGTHARRSSQLGLVTLLGESSVGAGVRRVEALVGADAYRFLAREHVLVSQLAGALKAPPEELPERVAGLLDRLRAAEKRLERIRAAQVARVAADLAAEAVVVDGVAVVTHHDTEAGDGDELRRLALGVRDRLRDGPAVVAVAGVPADRPLVVVAVTDQARERGLRAGRLARLAAGVLGGGGGGRDDVAQGGGADPTAIPRALDAVRHAVPA
ncbi:MAG: alanine--tRNA ligase [Mycobacteriales bacterium]